MSKFQKAKQQLDTAVFQMAKIADEVFTIGVVLEYKSGNHLRQGVITRRHINGNPFVYDSGQKREVQLSFSMILNVVENPETPLAKR